MGRDCLRILRPAKEITRSTCRLVQIMAAKFALKTLHIDKPMLKNARFWAARDEFPPSKGDSFYAFEIDRAWHEKESSGRYGRPANEQLKKRGEIRWKLWDRRAYIKLRAHEIRNELRELELSKAAKKLTPRRGQFSAGTAQIVSSNYIL